MKYNAQLSRKRMLAIFVICIAVAIITIVLLVVNCFKNIETELENNVRQSMEDVSHQNASALQSELRSKYTLASGMAQGLPASTAGIRANLTQAHAMCDLYRCKRMGYIDLEGNAITGDGHETKLGHWQVYVETLKGKACISDPIPDTVDGSMERITVITAPVYAADNQTVRGVLFVSYRTEIFREFLLVASYNEQGITCAARQNGNIMVGSVRAALDEGENLFERMQAYGNENLPVVAGLKADFRIGNSGFVKYQSDNERYLYYMPISVDEGGEQWYLCTIVPTDVLDDRATVFNKNIYTLVALILLCLVVCITICLLVYGLQHKQLLSIAFADPLTGGDNYVSFRARMRQRRGAGYIVSVDIADFKLINNTCGIKKGDALIREMWTVLHDMLTEGELAGHLTGDQFVIFLEDRGTEHLLRRIENCHERLCALAEKLKTPQLRPKFGIFAAKDSTKPEDGYGKALLAKKEIKDLRTRYYAFYDDSYRQSRIREQWIEDNFDTALTENRFEIWLQPQFSPADGRLLGAEALSRWRGERGEILPPGDFIPLLERSGRIMQLDEHVFRRICKLQKRLFTEGKAIPISVNLSRASLYDPDIVERYLSIVKVADVDIRLVRLEVTESAMVENEQVEKTLARFRRAGFVLMMDDFGSGYSSLSTLGLNCFDTIKIDKKLIDSIGNPVGEKVLTHVIDLVHSISLSVTAEGVEEERQVQFLCGVGCDCIQGYYYSKPIPVEDFEARFLK